MKKEILPLYREVRSQLVEKLAQGQWRPGDLMPSESKLAEMFGVAISTVRQAMHELESDEVLVRRQGKGTFVALHENPKQAGRFHSLVHGDGSKEIAFRSLLSANRIVMPERIAKKLGLRTSSRPNAHQFMFLSSFPSGPMVVTEITLPNDLFPGLSRKSFPDGSNLLYGIFQTDFQVNVIRVEEELTAVAANASCAKLLKLSQGSPILKIERLAYTFNGVAVEFRESWVNTRHVRYFREQGTAY